MGDILFYIEQKTYSSDDGVHYSKIHEYAKSGILDSRILLNTGGNYKFTYVGLIAFDDYIFSVLPKFFPSGLPTEEKEKCTRFLLKVLKKFSGKEELYIPETLSYSSIEQQYSEPAIADLLINYYLNYGIWEKKQKVSILGGEGNVNWPKTIETTSPIISSGTVFYPDTYRYKSKSQNDRIVTQIHKWATKYCINRYRRILPDFEHLNFEYDAPEKLEDIGEEFVLIKALQGELRETYIDVNLQLLFNLVRLINKKSGDRDKSQLSFYGTSAFHNVWESACKVAFNDISKDISSIFKAPNWIKRGASEYQPFDKTDKSNKRNKLIPDIISLYKLNDDDIYIIMDAKYYMVTFGDDTVSNNPGISDISKQILYQQILQNDEGSPARDCDLIVNTFIFPMKYDPEKDNHLATSDWLWGHIDSKIAGWEDRPVIVTFLPPLLILNCYLKGNQLDNSIFLNQLVEYRKMIGSED